MYILKNKKSNNFFKFAHILEPNGKNYKEVENVLEATRFDCPILISIFMGLVIGARLSNFSAHYTYFSDCSALF